MNAIRSRPSSASYRGSTPTRRQAFQSIAPVDDRSVDVDNDWLNDAVRLNVCCELVEFVVAHHRE
jgi:hypothetical protein